MKVVILAGGFGTRISEESYLTPKPMITIGDQPILWHIMKMYSYYGFNEFIICAGYKQQVIKEYFAHYYLHQSDITFDFSNDNRVIHRNHVEPWKVTIVDTGLNTMTGGRIKRIKDYIGDETFMMTYGDGISDVDINNLLAFHRSHERIATLTAIQPAGRFGMLEIDNEHCVQRFSEKKKEDSGWINGGFMVLDPEIFDYIDGDQISFENEPLERLSNEGQLAAYNHYGFWKCMDTMRDREKLNEMYQSNNSPWKVWN